MRRPVAATAARTNDLGKIVELGTGRSNDPLNVEALERCPTNPGMISQNFVATILILFFNLNFLHYKNLNPIVDTIFPIFFVGIF